MTAGALLAALLLVGLQHVVPPIRPHMLPGSAWLTSRAIGALTLVDGVSARVATNVPVARPDGHFGSAQSTTTGYAVDSDSGYVIGIDGGTLAKRSVKPLADSRKVFDVHPTSSALYAVERENHVVQAVRPNDISTFGAPMELPASTVAVANDSNRLWAADGVSGDLVSYDASSGVPQRRVHKGVHEPGSSKLDLTVADGQVVVVDRTHHVVLRVGSGGNPIASIPLVLQDDDLVSGSPWDSRLLIVRRSVALVRACPLNGDRCTADVTVGQPNADLGAAVEAQGHAFIPDHSAGTVHVVNLGQGTVRDTDRLLENTTRFELAVRDGTVYFNDPDSEKAGVIGTSGSLRRIDKYDPADPPPTDSSAATSSRTSSVTRTTPSPSPRTGTGTTAAPTGSSTASSLRVARIDADPGTPETGQMTSFTAEVAGVPPDTWSWTVAAPGGQPVPVAGTARFEHVFSQPGDYVVSLAVKAGSLEDRLTKTVHVAPPGPPVKCGDIVTRNVVLRTDLTCTGPGLVVQADDIVVDLDTHSISGAGTDTGIAVKNQRNVKIRNGSVRRFAAGIVLVGATASKIDRVAVSENSGKALDLDAGGVPGRAGGIEIRNSEIRGAARFQSLLDLSMTGLTATDSQILFDTVEQSVMTGVVCTRCRVNIGNSSNGTTVRGRFTDGSVNVSEADDLRIELSEFVRNSVRIGSASLRATVSRSRFSGADIALGNQTDVPGLKIEHSWFSDNRIGVRLGSSFRGLLDGLRITGNEFLNNKVAGVLVEMTDSGAHDAYFIGQNRFVSNGHQAGGMTDQAGSPVNDGLHLRVAGDGRVDVRDNTTENNAEYGIEATPAGVFDGGGNKSTNDPAGCLGVRCG